MWRGADPVEWGPQEAEGTHLRSRGAENKQAGGPGAGPLKATRLHVGLRGGALGVFWSEASKWRVAEVG